MSHSDSFLRSEIDRLATSHVEYFGEKVELEMGGVEFRFAIEVVPFGDLVIAVALVQFVLFVFRVDVAGRVVVAAYVVSFDE